MLAYLVITTDLLGTNAPSAVRVINFISNYAFLLVSRLSFLSPLNIQIIPHIIIGGSNPKAANAPEFSGTNLKNQSIHRAVNINDLFCHATCITILNIQMELLIERLNGNRQRAILMSTRWSGRRVKQSKRGQT